jgi:hypothetical protein
MFRVSVSEWASEWFRQHFLYLLNGWSGDQRKQTPCKFIYQFQKRFKKSKKSKTQLKKVPPKIGPKKIQKVKPVVKSKKLKKQSPQQVQILIPKTFSKI